MKGKERGAGQKSKTDGAGEAAFDADAETVYRLRIAYNGFTYTTGDLSNGGTVTLQTVETTFTLKNSEGNPIEGARVDLLKANGKGTGVKSLTGVDGVARFQVLPGFQHLFRVRYNGTTYTTDETVSIPD